MEENDPKILSPVLRWMLISLGFVSLALGVIGAFLPIMPTTPFLIVAAFCFSKSSPRLHLWLTSMPLFGDATIEWERDKVIRPKAKFLAISLILITFGYSIFFTDLLMIGPKVGLAILGSVVVIFIATRKSKP